MKKDHIEIPKPSSKFQKVNCNECGEQQVVYSHATTEIACNSCGNIISQSTGSKAKINGKVLGSAE
ncbi:MAG: 30S ribosomal protein S27e [Nitrosopumilaceae archaeon]|nr:30S ribosomal protein S27e [Nitrosopumilaceae archaeon]